MASNVNNDVDKLITFDQMGLEQDWYDQELDYRPPRSDDKPVRWPCRLTYDRGESQ
jgi:hypothetical protein